MSKLEVTPFQERYASSFRDLNLAWIQRYFAVEQKDLEQLENPRAIVNGGGQIFFIVKEERVVATCALIAMGAGEYEIAKMAVAETERGHGYGEHLMQACLDWAKQRGAKKIHILSNTVLNPAITLYKKFGFQTTHLGPHPDYVRCNIQMQLNLTPADAEQTPSLLK